MRADGRSGRDGGVRGHRGPPRRCPGADRQRLGAVHRRGSARQGRRRIARAGARGADRLWSRHAGQAHHREPRPRRHAQGGQPLRPADRARHHGGHRGHSGRCAAGLHGAGRTRAGWHGHHSVRRPAGRGRGQCARAWPHLSRVLRPRGRLGGRRPGHSRAGVADPARQPFQGNAGPRPPSARAETREQRPAGPARRQGPGNRQACAGDRRGGRPHHADERAARRREIHAGGAASFHLAAAQPARDARRFDDPFHRGAACRRRADGPATLPQPAPFGLHAGAGGRGHEGQARRGVARASRRALPGRAAGVRDPRARQPAPAARDRRGVDRAGQPPRDLSGPLPARRRHEPVPLRARAGPGLRVQAPAQRALHGAVPGPAVGPAARPGRSVHHRAGRQRGRSGAAAPGGGVGGGRGPGCGGA